MMRFVGRRLLQALPVVIGVVTIVFILIHLIPGDPVDLLLRDSAQTADRENIRHALGLDQPLYLQYFYFWAKLLRGDWGRSIVHALPVRSLIFEHFPATLLLAVSSLAFSCLISIPLGMWTAVRAGTWKDTMATGLSLAGISVPIFVVAPLAVLLFSIELRWLPVAGAGSFSHLVLPCGCLALGLSGILTRLVRSSVLENLGQDFVRTARAKGLRENAVLFKHVLRPALLPVVTLLGNMFGGLLAGAVLTETLFDWPGLGRLFFSAFQSRDFPLIQGIVLWISIVYVTINIAIDVLYTWIDPRVQIEGMHR